MKIVKREFKSDGKRIAAYFVYCPACKRAHRFIVENEADPSLIWEFNGDRDSPTFSPSLLVHVGSLAPEGEDERCHSYLTDGVWDFLADSTHGMVGKIPMIDFPENYRV